MCLDLGAIFVLQVTLYVSCLSQVDVRVYSLDGNLSGNLTLFIATIVVQTHWPQEFRLTPSG